MLKQRLARDGREAPLVDTGLGAKARGVDEEFGRREGRGLGEAEVRCAVDLAPGAGGERQ